MPVPRTRAYHSFFRRTLTATLSWPSNWRKARTAAFVSFGATSSSFHLPVGSWMNDNRRGCLPRRPLRAHGVDGHVGDIVYCRPETEPLPAFRLLPDLLLGE